MASSAKLVVGHVMSCERLGGIEFRPNAVASISAIRGKDYRDFEEFYTEYESEHGAAGLGKSIAPAGGWAVTAPIAYTGHALINRDIANLKAAMDGTGVTAGFLPVVAPASVLPNRTDEFYKTEEEALFAIADALHEEYAAVVESGLLVQIDDAFLASYYDVMVPPLSSGGLPQVGGAADRCAQSCAAWHSCRKVPLSRLLGKLEWSSHQRCPAEGYCRSDPPSKRRGLLAGNGEPSTRTRMARVGDGEAARRQGAAARRDQSCHQCGRTP